MATTPNSRTRTQRPRPFQIHLARLAEALAALDIRVPASRLQGLAAAFYGYRNTNALAAAMKAGEIVIPTAEAGHGAESLVVLRDPVANAPFGFVVPEDGRPFGNRMVTSPYGNLVLTPPVDERLDGWAGETQAMRRIRKGRDAVIAYAGESLDWQSPETAITALVADLLRYRHDLDEDGVTEEYQEPHAVAAAALRCYQRECLGEVMGLGEPTIWVEIDDLSWNLDWAGDKEPCVAALKAYAGASLEDEPEYAVGDLISDLLHVCAQVDHGSPIEVLRNALRSVSRSDDPTAPRIMIEIRIGR